MREYNTHNSLVNIRIENSESVEAFTEHFQRKYMASNFANDQLCAHLFDSRLTPFLSLQVLIYFVDTAKVMSSMEPVVLMACNLYYNIYSNPELAAIRGATTAAAYGAQILNITVFYGSRGQRNSTGSAVSGACNTNCFSHRTNRKYCELHKEKMIHMTEDCQVMKDVVDKIATQKKWSASTSCNGVKKCNTYVWLAQLDLLVQQVQCLPWSTEQWI
ncbi:hypothetical protein BDF14DRAFT_976080 [Spinellus fusiger]|nr:hypothetical protein BDF14DRAFT_976080 [Spinellus fusiger]